MILPKPVIGLEVHVQLNTVSKLLCACSTKQGEPNSFVCEVCLGIPGAKPMLNKRAVDMAVRIALALNCKINREFFFSRKTYFYPDLAKNYQVTQYELPIGENGFVNIVGEKGGEKISIWRAHLEEDPAALVHQGSIEQSNYSLVDYNRSGIPLVEIVTAPELSSPAQARDFLNGLLILLDYLSVFDQKNSVLKVDANISLLGGERVEIKNILGFKAVEAALEFEVRRQETAFKKREPIVRETRGFDEVHGTTFSLRKKETDEDYGYIFDPDLPVIVLEEKHFKSLEASMPEFFGEKVSRFKSKLGLSDYDAKVIAANKKLSDLFEETSKIVAPQFAARFFSRELLGILNYNNLALQEISFESSAIAELLLLLEHGKVSEKNAKEAMIKYALEGVAPKIFLEQHNLLLDLEGNEVEAAVGQALAQNPSAVSDLKAGKEKALNFIVGLVMRMTKAKAQPREIKKIVEEKISRL